MEKYFLNVNSDNTFGDTAFLLGRDFYQYYYKILRNENLDDKIEIIIEDDTFFRNEKKNNLYFWYSFFKYTMDYYKSRSPENWREKFLENINICYKEEIYNIESINNYINIIINDEIKNYKYVSINISEKDTTNKEMRCNFIINSNATIANFFDKMKYKFECDAYMNNLEVSYINVDSIENSFKNIENHYSHNN